MPQCGIWSGSALFVFKTGLDIFRNPPPTPTPPWIGKGPVYRATCPMNGSQTCDFTSFSTVYGISGQCRVMMKRNRNLFQVERISPQVGLKPGTATSVGQSLTHWATGYPSLSLVLNGWKGWDCAFMKYLLNLRALKPVALTIYRAHDLMQKFVG